MVNVKEMVYEALKKVFPETSDSWPQDWQGETTVVYTEEDNSSRERSGSKTTKSYCRYRVDILSQRSTSLLTQQIDSVLAFDPETETGLGMTRTMCQDDNAGENRHKILRYECIVGERDKKIYGI